MFVALISTPKHLQKSTISIQNGKLFPDPVENPIVSQLTIPSTNYSTEEGHTTTIFLNPYTHTLYGTKKEAALMTLNNTTDRDSTSNQYPQTTTHQSWRDLNPVFPSMWPMGSNRRESASALASFKKTTYWTDEWTRQLLPLKRKSWEIFGIPEQGMRFHGLWWTVVVFFNCSYLF